VSCPGCEWRGYVHHHIDAEDGPRKGCCEHTCEGRLMADYLVTYLVPVTVRVENVGSTDEAAATAWEWWIEQNVVEKGQIGLDSTDFYFYDDGGDKPWALDVSVGEDPR
jgi:hypothetical protein